jgi:hypothetical protein
MLDYMSFTCPLCRENWIVLSKLCDKCDTIRHLISIYSLDTVSKVLDKVLIIDKFKEKTNIEPVINIDNT